MNTHRPTLGLPAGIERRASSVAPRKPMVAKGHDAILKGLQDRSAFIEIYPMCSDEPIIGKMINRDRYTITVELANGQRRTIYKHAIESFGESV